MRYTRQGPDGYAVRPCAPNALKPLFDRVFVADTDEGFLLVDPSELRSVHPGAVVAVQVTDAYGEGPLRGVKWFGEWDLVWIGQERAPGGSRGPARKFGQVLHRIRYTEAAREGSPVLRDEGGDVL